MTFGDYGTLGASGVLGGPVGAGDSAWRLVAGHYRSDGFRRNSFPGPRRHQRLRRNQRATEIQRDIPRTTCARFTAMWVDLDNGYDAFSIDNSRTTLSDKPGQDAQISRALAMRLDYDGANAFDVVSRTLSEHRAVSIRSTATGETTSAGARTRRTTISSGSTANTRP